jgi:hypothetical protein
MGEIKKHRTHFYTPGEVVGEKALKNKTIAEV